MSHIHIEKWTMPAASLGRENPLPMLAPRLSATAGPDVDESVPLEDRRHFGYGLDAGWLPHRSQDDYDRSRANREFLAIVLENEFLRATILPEVGGRLWSLVHKPTGRELLFVNPVFQPANLAVRGAWVTGGVEWNPCVYGHSPYTCSPMFAAVVEGDQAGDILRIYEWDRTRCVPYQLDFSLPCGSPFLFVRVRLANPHPQTIPMYWWSNIAVPESPDVRVLVPAERAYTYEYWGQVYSVPVPRHQDLDLTYSTNISHAADYFFRIPDNARPWIAALDGEGRGLIQTSTSRLVGRKLYAWGTNPGGRRWQEFLSTPGRHYLEIQAGLARTQMECLPMPAGAKWDWLEAYGLMDADPAKVHGSDWSAAVTDVADQLERMLPRELLEAQLQRTAALADQPPKSILHRGSGWGALERHRRERFGEPPFCSPGLSFDDESLGEDQAPWLFLLENDALPDRDPSAEPGAWMVQKEWRDLLQAAAQDQHPDHWFSQLHLGLMHYADGNHAAAQAAWQQSLNMRPSAWAYRNLAWLRAIEGRCDEALSLYHQAHRLLPELQPLFIEFAEALLAAGRGSEILVLIESLPERIRCHSRMRLLEARAKLSLDCFDHIQPILQEDYELADIREGETILTDLWFAWHSRQSDQKNHCPPGNRVREDLSSPLPPSHIDFRVTPSHHSAHHASPAATVSRVDGTMVNASISSNVSLGKTIHLELGKEVRYTLPAHARK